MSEDIGMTGEDMATCIDELRAELAAKDSLIIALEECLKAVDDNWSLSTQRAAWFKLEAARVKLAEIKKGKS